MLNVFLKSTIVIKKDISSYVMYIFKMITKLYLKYSFIDSGPYIESGEVKEM